MVVKAPDKFPLDMDDFSIFLAGSIEMGTAEMWQDRAVELLESDYRKNYIIFNPRRNDWDSTWVQSIENDKFREQVEWELEYLTSADVTFFYFDPNTKSPITLMELGLSLAGCVVDPNIRNYVVCPEGFWRRGNVEITCKHYGVKVYDTLEDAVIAFKGK